jgi:hypothetical protein
VAAKISAPTSPTRTRRGKNSEKLAVSLYICRIKSHPRVLTFGFFFPQGRGRGRDEAGVVIGFGGVAPPSPYKANVAAVPGVPARTGIGGVLLPSQLPGMYYIVILIIIKCIYVCLFIYVYVHMYVCVYAWIYVCVCIYIYIY